MDLLDVLVSVLLPLGVGLGGGYFGYHLARRPGRGRHPIWVDASLWDGRLHDLMDQSGAPDRCAVLAMALATYDLILSETVGDRVLFVADADGGNPIAVVDFTFTYTAKGKGGGGCGSSA